MTSTIVANGSDLFNSQAQVQKQSQVFESLKTQLDASSFENLFLKGNSGETKPPEYVAHQNADTQREGKRQEENTGRTDSEAVALKAPQILMGVQPVLHFHEVTQTEIYQFKDQRVNGFSTGQCVNRAIDDATGLSGDSMESMICPRYLSSAAHAVDFSSPAMVIGINGEKVRLWMRDPSADLDRDQLISKIRAELSWAGMALDSFMLNGRKLVGAA